jgi:hypothetical protein
VSGVDTDDVARVESLAVLALALVSIGGLGKLCIDVETKFAGSDSAVPPATVSRAGTCSTARTLVAAALTNARAHRMEASFAAATSGLRAVPLCDDDVLATAVEGTLLSTKARAERALGRGDWRTDVDIADLLLVQCELRAQSTRARLRAQCESQENENIAERTDDDLN